MPKCLRCRNVIITCAEMSNVPKYHNYVCRNDSCAEMSFCVPKCFSTIFSITCAEMFHAPKYHFTCRNIILRAELFNNFCATLTLHVTLTSQHYGAYMLKFDIMRINCTYIITNLLLRYFSNLTIPPRMSVLEKRSGLGKNDDFIMKL